MIPPLAALFSWPIVSLILFNQRSLQYAIVITIVAGYLLLPENRYYNLPILPTLDKGSIPALVAFLFALSFAQPAQGLRGLVPKGALPVILLIAFIWGGMFTSLTNGDAIEIGGRVLQGTRIYDGFSSVLAAMVIVLPLLLGRKFLADKSGQRALLVVFVISALAYSPLTWIELRLSPQMNNWVYGYFPHQWVQHIRANGYRPVVFLEHGLRLSIFLSAAVIAAVALFKVMPNRRGQIMVAVGLLMMTLVFSKSLGALMITLVLLPVVFFLGTRTQLLCAAILGGVVLLYPMTRAAGLVPVNAIQETVAQYSPDRAGSLGARLRNEDTLLARAGERPLFGWGGWGRSRVVDEFGNDITIADGYWIIVFGVGGWVRYISEFGLMIFPLGFLFLRARTLKIDKETAALAIIMVGNLLDMVPNSSMTPLTWLVAGALWGRLEMHPTQPDDITPSSAAEAGSPITNPYTRQTTRKTRVPIIPRKRARK